MAPRAGNSQAAAAAPAPRPPPQSRLAGGLEPAQACSAERNDRKADTVAFARRGGHDHVVGRLQLGQIGARAECRGLAGADDNTRATSLCVQPIGKQRRVPRSPRSKHVHRASGRCRTPDAAPLRRHLDRNCVSSGSVGIAPSLSPVTVRWCTISSCLFSLELCHDPQYWYTSKLNQTGRVLTMIERTIFREEHRNFPGNGQTLRRPRDRAFPCQMGGGRHRSAGAVAEGRRGRTAVLHRSRAIRRHGPRLPL